MARFKPNKSKSSNAQLLELANLLAALAESRNELKAANSDFEEQDRLTKELRRSAMRAEEEARREMPPDPARIEDAIRRATDSYYRAVERPEYLAALGKQSAAQIALDATRERILFQLDCIALTCRQARTAGRFAREQHDLDNFAAMLKAFLESQGVHSSRKEKGNSYAAEIKAFKKPGESDKAAAKRTGVGPDTFKSLKNGYGRQGRATEESFCKTIGARVKPPA